MLLILGNHDIFSVDKYKEVALEVYNQELKIRVFTFAHHPTPALETDDYIISEHVHPVVKLKGLANQRLKFPCFFFGEQQALLPSFGALQVVMPLKLKITIK